LVPDTVDSTGCGYSVATSLFPPTSTGTPEGLALVKVTHGGQLGAPYAQQDCGEVLGNPCIRGQWQHVRHYQGKGNPRDTVTALHNVNPKGQFDALLCACLPCCIGDTEQGGEVSEIGKKWQLCNKDDHKICGPMPRPAPGNALIWSGIGKYQHADDLSGKGAEWAVIRVYIVDRSEPGGQHPGGAVAPADIYCFQAWTTGVSVSKKPNFDQMGAAATAIRKAIAEDSCKFLQAVVNGDLPLDALPSDKVGELTANISDRGPLHNGNRQIHPSTSATCP
jgi:hypothetical protein